jgi:peptidyl-prolyl cis-trans isomerase D
LLAERIAQQGEQNAQADLARLQQGETLASLAESRSLEVRTAEQVGRMGASVDPMIAQQAFSLPHPEADKPSVGMVEMAAGGHALIALSAVVDGDPASTEAASVAALREQLSQAVGSAEAAAFVKALRLEAKIDVVEGRL